MKNFLTPIRPSRKNYPKDPNGTNEYLYIHGDTLYYLLQKVFEWKHGLTVEQEVDKHLKEVPTNDKELDAARWEFLKSKIYEPNRVMPTKNVFEIFDESFKPFLKPNGGQKVSADQCKMIGRLLETNIHKADKEYLELLEPHINYWKYSGGFRIW